MLNELPAVGLCYSCLLLVKSSLQFVETTEIICQKGKLEENLLFLTTSLCQVQSTTVYTNIQSNVPTTAPFT